MKIIYWIGIIIVIGIVAMINWEIALFGIPFGVLIAYVIYNGVMYQREMKEWVSYSEFILEERDGELYVVPRSKK